MSRGEFILTALERLQMTRQEACNLLGLKDPFSAEDLKSAFRKAALQTHPDKGGNTMAFLTVHAAYERLVEDGSFADSEEFKETPEELRARLMQIARAFEEIDRQFLDHIPENLNAFDVDLRQRMENISDKNDLQNKWPKEVNASFKNLTQQMGEWLKGRTDQVAVDFNHWLNTLWEEHLRQAQTPDEETKLSPASFYVIALTIGLFAVTIGLMFLTAYALPGWLSLLLLPVGLPIAANIHPEKAEKVFPENFIPQLQDDNFVMDPSHFTFPVKRVRLSDESAFHIGLNGAGIGWMLGGPWGAVLGGLVGGVIGWFTGERFEVLKANVLNESYRRLNPLLDNVQKEWRSRLKRLKEEYLQRAEENYKEAARRTIKLLAEK